MTQQDYSNDLVFCSNGEEYACIDGSGPWKPVTPSTELEIADGNITPSIIFNISPAHKEIARFTEKGFYYKGEFIEDAGEVYRLLKEVLGQMKIEQNS
jgi:hypothetical protein